MTLVSILLLDDADLSKNGVHFLRYGVNPRLDVGVGYWGTPGRIRPAVNWELAPARKGRPAILTGYGAEPLGTWEDDGVFLSLVKPFGAQSRPSYAFAAYFREIDGGTNHLIGGVSQPLTSRCSVFVGRYPFNTWDGAVMYQLSPRLQVGLWACDFGRSTKFGLSVGTGWRMRKR